MEALFLVFQELPGLPWCPVVKNLPSNAIPGEGTKIPNAAITKACTL